MDYLRNCIQWVVLLFWISCLRGVTGQFDPEFTLQNVWGRLQPDTRSLIQCLSDDSHKKIKFQRVLDTGQGAKLPKSSQQFMQGKPVFARILFMHPEDTLSRVGAFQCRIEKNKVPTRIVTLKLPPTTLMELNSVHPYLTANAGDSVDLEVNPTRPSGLPVRWTKNGSPVPDWDGLLKVTVHDAKKEDSGVYECFYEGMRGEGLHALIRLIVRGCPEDLYGDACDQPCPPCHNGGVCHDKWGVCVCPAGFSGPNCETPCGGNHFGPDCSKSCSPPQNNSVNTDELCALHLFCKPDPYGCSCAPGFKGPTCMEHCEPGWYGADCKQPCHCAYGISSCNRITGACSGGCARGWRGQSCQIEDPNSNSTFAETTTMMYCSPGTYGPSCERSCHCHGNENCHIVTGHCAKGCEEGWGGPSCGVCKSGRFGENCEYACHCEGGHRNCDKDGFCYAGCEAGWAGFTCQAECTPGRFGPNCASTCHCHPSTAAPCDKITGECEHDCEAGYMGKDCQKLCPANMYGVNCANMCHCSNGAPCSRVDGTCSCDGRWKGSTCNESVPQIVAATDEEVNTGQQTFLSCTADAVPQPIMNITCSDFPGLRVSHRNLEQNQLQAVVKVKPETSGTFEFYCTAGNEHGFDTKKITLTVVDPPRLTTQPTLLETFNDSISITWEPWNHTRDEGGLSTDKVDYMVIYKEPGSSEWTKAGSWTGHVPSFSLDNLRPNTPYQVAVKCRRGKDGGEGEEGPPLVVKTLCGIALPDGIPLEFLPEKITQTSVTLTWKNPAEAFLQCPLTSYRLSYHPEAADTILSTVDTDGIETRVELEDLTSNTVYVMRLYPVTEVGQSKYFAELIIKTGEMIPGPVSNLKLEVVWEKPDLLLVSWEAPSEEHGSIKGYVVTSVLIQRGQCPKEEEGDQKTRKTHSEETEITLQNLHPYSTYNISVLARTSAGEGEAVTKTIETPPSVPSAPPSNIRTTSATNDSLSFSWDPVPCEDANGDVIQYDYALVSNDEGQFAASPLVGRIKRAASTTFQNVLRIFNPVADLHVTINNLKPYTSYGFLVAGVTAAGRGVLSDIVFHKTDEGIPGAPVFLNTFHVSDQEVGVSWQPPDYPNGVVINYRIRAWQVGRDELMVQQVFRNATGEEEEEALIPGLKPATTYKITVEASTKAGWGNCSKEETTTLDGIPGEPSEISMLENKHTSVKIAWREPIETNGEIRGYNIRYVPISTLDPIFNATSFSESEIEVGNSVTEQHLQNLHPSTQYKILVSAKTSIGYGPEATFVCWTVILGDHVSPTVKTLVVKATNDTIPILFSTTGSSSVYKYQVVVEDSRHNSPINESLLSDFDTAVAQKGLPYYIAAELDPENVSETGEQTFVVGDRRLYGRYRNVHLNPGHEYKIRIRTLVIKDKELKSVLSKAENQTAGTTFVRIDRKKRQIFGLDPILFILIVMMSLLLLILMTFFTILAICRKRSRKHSTNLLCNRDSGLSASMTWSVMYKVPQSQDLDDASPAAFRTLQLTEKTASLRRSKSDTKIARGLRIETLEEYLINAKSSNLLGEEFKRLIDGQISPWTVARKSGNLRKNRYGNILPYDRFRVVLNTETNKSDADYINASYIDGFRRNREYIVTQGPLENTVHDFWRMVWQESSPVIVMVTDLVENGKKKCAKYWPDDSMDSGDLHILLIHSEQCKDMVVRTILIRKIDEIRTHRVIQYQFTGWPDQTVPSSLTSLIKFTKRVREDHTVLQGPIIVHCSAGAGRSGTYISIDALCQQAAEEKRVDVFRFVNNARHQRIHLVQTMEQYAFIYEALVEALHFEDTSVPLDKIAMYLKEVNYMCTVDRRSLILKQYNKLNRLQKKSEVNKCSVALSEENIFKNRDPLTVPGNSSRVKLEIDIEDGLEQTDYINAIYVDGYKKPKQFLVTQMPLVHTTEDFWSLIYQQKSPLIVMLNGSGSDDGDEDLNVGIYWPNALGECSFGDFELQLITYEEQADLVIRILRLSNKMKFNEDPVKIVQLQYKGWMSEVKPSSILSLVEMTELWHRKSTGGPITVHCLDGATRSGLFIAAHHVCDQVENEGLLDVYQIVKNIRQNRPEFIPNSDQYRLLFEVAQEVSKPFLLQNEQEQRQSTKKLSIKI
ncbi:hypothetical protein JTE90_002765 [Oedothorax gibbosus]|uniref:protein-tyrosine-phosphatase n=1 Tax=Oedothorax gibbosus TaxID=931172 RepID=A0AAV6ULR4_9ARAC|nr:hypothetical protein JTE90_002765 [Oedothorax gibbosus]